MTDLSIIIVNYNTKDLTLKCLKSIYDLPPKCSFETYLVDNNSEDQSVSQIKKHFPKVKVLINEQNLGFSKGNNTALKVANSKYHLLLNSDTVVRRNSIEELVNFAKTSEFGILSCKLLNPDLSFQPNAGQLPTPINLFLWLSGLDDILKINSYQARGKSYYQNIKTVGWVGGTAMLIKNEVIEKIGLLDEKIFMYGEDVEYCLRASRAGFKVGWTEETEIIHLGGGSLKTPKYNQWLGEFKGLIYIYQKYYGFLASELLAFFIEFFVLIRIIIFTLVGKLNFAKTYVKISESL